MHLLERNGAGEFSLTKDFGDDTPRYAILSHTWGADAEEVTFRDLMDGAGKGKAGYNKIRFCREQANVDGLQYFLGRYLLHRTSRTLLSFRRLSTSCFAGIVIRLNVTSICQMY